MVREFSAALAVVAVYVLVLLAPLHQAAGLQKDLAALGFDSAASWSICAAAVPDTGDERSAADLKCPAAGIGKQALAAIEPVAIDLALPRLPNEIAYPAVLGTGHWAVPVQAGQPRAPPVAA